MAPITFMASTNRETRDRGRHRAEVVRSNIKVTTQTRSTRSCSDAECAVMDFGEVGPIKGPEKISLTGSVGVLSPLHTDSADSAGRRRVLC